MTDIIIAENKPLVGELTKTAWIAPKSMSWDEWLEVGEALSLASGAIHFWVGDWILAGEHRWGEKYAQAVDATKFVIGTLQNDAWVASRVPPSLRNEQLSWTHHYIVSDSKFDAETRKDLLDKAALRGWTTRHMRQVIKNWYHIYGGIPRSRMRVSGSPMVSVLPAAPTIVHLHNPGPPPARLDWKGYAKRFCNLKNHWRRRAIAAEEQVERLRNQITDMEKVYTEEASIYHYETQGGKDWGFYDE